MESNRWVPFSKSLVSNILIDGTGQLRNEFGVCYLKLVDGLCIKLQRCRNAVVVPRLVYNKPSACRQNGGIYLPEIPLPVIYVVELLLSQLSDSHIWQFACEILSSSLIPTIYYDLNDDLKCHLPFRRL